MTLTFFMEKPPDLFPYEGEIIDDVNISTILAEDNVLNMRFVNGSWQWRENILGLNLYKGHVLDPYEFRTVFVWTIAEELAKGRRVNILSAEEERGLRASIVRVDSTGDYVEEVDSRIPRIGTPDEDIYLDSLEKLVNEDDCPKVIHGIYKNVLHKVKIKRAFLLTWRDTDLIKYSFWEYLGNEIPTIDLNRERLQKELNKRGYSFCREVGARGWYFGPNYIGNDCYEVFDHMESFLGLKGRSRLEFI